MTDLKKKLVRIGKSLPDPFQDDLRSIIDRVETARMRGSQTKRILELEVGDQFDYRLDHYHPTQTVTVVDPVYRDEKIDDAINIPIQTESGQEQEIQMMMDRQVEVKG